jgi:uncharacterized membrane protein
MIDKYQPWLTFNLIFVKEIGLDHVAMPHATAAHPPEPTQATANMAPEQADSTEVGYVPYVAPERPSIFSLKLTKLEPGAPLRWVKQGWQDYLCCPKSGLFYGLMFFVMGHVLWAVFKTAPAYVLGLSASFLLLGPFLCLGLYHASRSIQQGTVPSLRDSMLAWRPTAGAMGIFAGVLLVLELVWGRASLVIFAVAFSPVPGIDDTMSQIFHPDNIGFVISYVLVGGAFATMIFGMSAIAIPMIMDRQIDAVSAALTSLRACIQNPGVMFLWGATITTLIGLSMLPYFIGLIVVGPIIGHATWHAYREVVPTEATT